MAAVLTVGLLFAAASPAAAHAELTGTEPGGGAVLTGAPDQVLLRFTEPVEVSFGSIRIFDESGERVEAGQATHPSGRSTAVVLRLPSLEKGAYVVTWRVVSADSHPVRGAFTFRIGPAPPGADDSQALAQRLLNAQGGSTAVGAAYGAVRFAVFSSLILLVGAGAFALWLWPAGLARPRLRRMLVAAWVVAVLGTALGIGLQGAYAGGLSLSDALKPSVFDAVLETRFGRVWAVRLALLVVAGGLLWRLARRRSSPEPASPGSDEDEPRRGRHGVRTLGAPALMAGLVGLALLATPGLAGHAGTGSLIPLAVAADVAHLGAVSVWLGGLAVVLAVLLPQADGESLGRVIPRFSRVAFVAVVTILATGALQGWRQVGSLDALTTTTYGRLLLVKTALFAVMVGLAVTSRSWVRRRYPMPRPAMATAGPAAIADPALAATPPAGAAAKGPGAASADDPALALGRLRRSVLAEAAVAVVVVAVTSLLVNAVPAKTALAKPFSAELVGKGLLVEVTVDPAKAGPLDLHVYTLTPAGAVRDVEDLTARLSLPDKDVGPITAPMRRAGPGHFAAYGFDVPIAGKWRLEVAARVSEVDVVRAAATVPIR